MNRVWRENKSDNIYGGNGIIHAILMPKYLNQMIFNDIISDIDYNSYLEKLEMTNTLSDILESFSFNSFEC